MNGRWHRFFPLLVATLGVLAYANSFQGALVLDDYRTISGSPGLGEIWTGTSHAEARSRPVVNATFAMNFGLGGLNPADYHAVNLMIHLVNALLLYGLVWRALCLPGAAASVESGAKTLAFIASAIWCVHPLGTGAVTYISQRYEILMASAYLLVLYALLRAATARRPGGWYAAAVAACLGGMGCKEVMVTAPVMAAAFDVACLAGSVRVAMRRRWWLHLLLAACWGWLAYLLVIASRTSNVASFAQGQGFSWPYLLTQSQVLTHYLSLSVWPATLCVDYAWPLAGSVREVWLNLLLIGGLVAGTALALWRRPRLGFLGLFFFAVLGPTSSFIPRPDTAFEYRMYLPLAAVVTALTLGAGWLIAKLPVGAWMRRAVGGVVVGTVLAALMVTTHSRNAVYASDETAWRDAVEKRPANLRAKNNLVTALLTQRRTSAAERAATELLAQVQALLATGRVDNAVAAAHPLMAYPLAHNQLGLIRMRQQRPAEAIPHFSEALQVDPGYVLALFNRGVAFYVVGRRAEAVADWRRAAVLQPGYAAAHALLGVVLAEEGAYREAVGSLRTAMRLAPQMLYAQCELAWLLATSPDPALRNGREAVELAERVVNALEGRSFRSLDVLAASWAECGRFEDAARTAQRALDQRVARQHPGRAGGMDPTGDDGAAASSYTVGEMEARLDRYRRGIPFRMGDVKDGSGSGSDR